jgi:hypothetical protein
LRMRTKRWPASRREVTSQSPKGPEFLISRLVSGNPTEYKVLVSEIKSASTVVCLDDKTVAANSQNFYNCLVTVQRVAGVQLFVRRIEDHCCITLIF